jgi:glutaredoxin
MCVCFFAFVLATKASITQAIANNEVVVFSKVSCPFCAQTKDLFRALPLESPAMIFELDQRMFNVAFIISSKQFQAETPVPPFLLFFCLLHILSTVDDGAQIQKELANVSGQRTVPNIFIKVCSGVGGL